MIYALIVFSLMTPLLTILAYRQGIRDGRAIVSKQPLKPLIQPPRASKENEETKRLSKILNNIDNYNGTGENQEAVSK